MSLRGWSIVIGGLAPALLLGLASFVQKLGATAGVSPGVFLIVVGVTTTITGLVLSSCERDWSWTATSLGYAALFGVFWATATGGVAIALRRFDGQISQLAPLYNLNTLVAVTLGLVCLHEWRTVSADRMVFAAVLMIAGGILAARA